MEREKRETKAVNRLLPEEADAKEKPEFTIPEGTGMPLRDILGMEDDLKKISTDSDDLILFHRYLFGRPGKQSERKRNIRDFRGFNPADSVDGKLDALLSNSGVTVATLKTWASLLQLEKSGNREALCERVNSFCAKPAIAKAKKSAASTGPKPAKKPRTSTGSASAMRFADEENEDEDEEEAIVAPKSTGTKSKPATSHVYPPSFAKDVRVSVLTSAPITAILEAYPTVQACISAEIANRWKDLSDGDKAKYNGKAGAGAVAAKAVAQVKLAKPATLLKAAPAPIAGDENEEDTEMAVAKGKGKGKGQSATTAGKKRGRAILEEEEVEEDSKPEASSLSLMKPESAWHMASLKMKHKAMMLWSSDNEARIKGEQAQAGLTASSWAAAVGGAWAHAEEAVKEVYLAKAMQAVGGAGVVSPQAATATARPSRSASASRPAALGSPKAKGKPGKAIEEEANEGEAQLFYL